MLILGLSLITSVQAAEPTQVRGVVAQIDVVHSGGTHVWLRPELGDPVRVQWRMPDVLPEVGDEVVFQVRWQDPVVDRARDGVVRTWPTAMGIGWQPVPRPGSERYADVMTGLLAILGVIFVGVFLLSRSSGQGKRGSARRRTEALPSGWGVESTDLPADPAEALAELARRADEEHT